MALDPVVRTALAVLLDRLTIGTRCAIQLHAVAHNRAQAEHLRAVRILGGFAAGMMLAMNGSPLAGNHRGAQPGPEAEKCASTGWKSTPRWAWLRCRYRVTAKMVSWVTSRKYRAMAPSPQPVRPD